MNSVCVCVKLVPSADISKLPSPAHAGVRGIATVILSQAAGTTTRQIGTLRCLCSGRSSRLRHLNHHPQARNGCTRSKVIGPMSLPATTTRASDARKQIAHHRLKSHALSHPPALLRQQRVAETDTSAPKMTNGLLHDRAKPTKYAIAKQTAARKSPSCHRKQPSTGLIKLR